MSDKVVLIMLGLTTAGAGYFAAVRGDWTDIAMTVVFFIATLMQAIVIQRKDTE